MMTIPSIDGLKRLSGKTYTGVGSTPGIAGVVDPTPNVTYCYDGLIYQSGGCVTATRGGGGSAADAPKGQMTGYGSQVDGGDAAQNYLHIDPLGRVLKSVQRLVSGASGSAVVEYPFIYTYQASGALSSVQYPISNRVVTYTQGSNRDLTTTVQSGTTNYLSGMTYTSQGALSGAAMGSGVNQSFSYNGRGQMTSATAALNGSTLFGQTLQYGQSTSTNNGNVASQTINAGAAGTFNQYYSYDSANRLTLASEGVAPSGAGCPSGVTWCHQYGIDAFGNVWQSANTGSMATPWLVQNGSSWYDIGGTVNNKLSGIAYDWSGNQAQFPEATGRTAFYDAENRLTTVAGSGTPASYFYDGEGRRVKKNVSGLVTAYVRNSDGELMQEYGGAAASASSRYYLVQDHLGSTRLVTDGFGVCQSRMDYLPFGGSVPRSGNCYGADAGVTQRFTGKERDAETGLDYFEVRYYSGPQGRFTSPDDPGFNDPSDPQSWNLFSYGLNNPLRFSDPTGHEPCENGINPDNGNICVVKTDQAPKVDPTPSGVGILDLSWTFTKVALASANQGAQQLIQGTMDYMSRPRDPGCMAGYVASGSGIGFWAGGGLGTLGLAGGPAAAATIPGGAAGGASLGGAVGGLGGLVMCMTSSGGGGGGGGYKRPKSGLSGKEGAKDVPSWAKGERPRIGESGRDFAKRLLDSKYGPGSYDRGPTSEFNRIQKWGDRAFE